MGPSRATHEKCQIGNGHYRPVLNTGEYIDASVASIGDQALRNLPRVGSLDQLTHADDTLITFTDWPQALAERYRAQLSS